MLNSLGFTSPPKMAKKEGSEDAIGWYIIFIFIYITMSSMRGGPGNLCSASHSFLSSADRRKPSPQSCLCRQSCSGADGDYDDQHYDDDDQDHKEGDHHHHGHHHDHIRYDGDKI